MSPPLGRTGHIIMCIICLRSEKFYISIFYIVFSSCLTGESTSCNDMLCCNVFIFKSLPKPGLKLGGHKVIRGWSWDVFTLYIGRAGRGRDRAYMLDVRYSYQTSRGYQSTRTVVERGLTSL